MADLSGSIDLSVTRVIGIGTAPSGRISLQLYSTDLSGAIAYTLEASMNNGIQWASVNDSSGSAMGGSLSASTANFESWVVERDAVKYRLSFAATVTGNVSYIVKS